LGCGGRNQTKGKGLYIMSGTGELDNPKDIGRVKLFTPDGNSVFGKSMLRKHQSDTRAPVTVETDGVQLLGVGGIVNAMDFVGGDMGIRINAAIDYLAGLGGGTVIVPEGNHTITTSIAPANATNYVLVKGAASYSPAGNVNGGSNLPTKFTQGATNTYIIDLTSKGYIGFEGIQFLGVNNHSAVLIYGYNAAFVHFRNCYMSGGYDGTNIVYLNYACKHWLLENCQIGRYNNAVGASCVYMYDVSHVKLDNCRGRCNGHAIRITGSNGAWGEDITFNRCGWLAGYGNANTYDAYYIDNSGLCKDIRITDCWQDEATKTRYGINIQNASPGFIGVYGGKMAGATGPWNDVTRIAVLSDVEA